MRGRCSATVQLSLCAGLGVVVAFLQSSCAHLPFPCSYPCMCLITIFLPAFQTAAAAMESYSRAYPHLVKLHMLQEIADVACAFADATVVNGLVLIP